MWRALLISLSFVSCAPSNTKLFAVDFGTVRAGEVHTAPMRVVNNGRTPSQLLRIEQREGLAGFTIEPDFTPLPAGSETKWNVVFDGNVPGEFVARFVAVFDTGEAEVSLRAYAGEPCVFSAPLDFGPGPRGKRTLQYRVINTSSTTGRFSFGSLAPPFSTSFSGNATAAPGTGFTIDVSFDGTTPGTFEQRWLLQYASTCTPGELLVTASVEQSAIVAKPGRLHFGDDATQLKVELRNTTSAAVELTPRIEGGGFKLPNEAKFTIDANASVELTVLREDFTTTDLFRELSFSTNSYPREFRVPLLARTPTRCVTATESNVLFPPQEARCSSATRFVTLKNDCPHEVKVGRPRTDAPFAVVSAKPGVLAAGATVEIGIAIRSEIIGTAASALTVPIDVLDGSEDVVVALSGSTTPVTLRDERRVIPLEAPPVDMLLVIDDKPAMSAFAPALLDNLASLNAYLSANGAKPKYAVTSTSMAASEQGRLRAGWLTEPTTTELQTYAAHRGAQTAPSSCLEAIAAAFSAPLRDDAQHMGGFRRSGATLMVLCITANADETRAPPLQLFARIRDVTPKEMFVGVYARFTAGAVCGGTRDTGALSAFVAFSNGMKEEICTPDWAFERIGKTAISGYRTTHHLTEFPDLERAPLKVFIDSAEIPRRDPTFNALVWNYASSINAVSFEALYAPEPGRTLRLTYAPQCSR